VSPRALEASVRPRRLVSASGRPLNFTVRPPMAMRRIGKVIVALITIVVPASCNDDSGSCCNGLPQNGGLYATFNVAGDQFHASIIDANGKEEARALWAGSSSARIPGSPLICDAVDWNAPWSWHMDPENLRFSEITIEVCQGTPSYVEANCKTFGGGQYCPVGEMVELRDCDASPECPAVPH
jgi:hypothetical protein